MGDKDSPPPLHTLEEENAHLKYLNFFQIFLKNAGHVLA